MIQIHIIAILVAMAFYSIVNSALIVTFFATNTSTRSYTIVLCDLLIKTIISVGIAFLFFLILARVFCWTAWLTQCAECICFPLTFEDFALKNSMPSNILFFASVTAVQLAIIKIPQSMAKMKFTATVLISNLIATLVKMVIIDVWGL